MSVIILFVSSTILIALLLLLKRAELRRELRFFESTRAVLDVQVEQGVFYTTHILPKRVVYHSVELANNTAHMLMLMLLKGLRAIERKLLGVSNVVKGKKEIHRSRASNAYLEDVSNHKKELVNGRQNGELKE